MKRRHLVVLVSAFTLLTIVFIAAVTVGVGIGTDPGREQIRALVEQQVGGRIHGKLHIGRVRGGILTGLTIDSFAIRDKEDSLLISTGRVTLQYDPRDLIDRRLLLRNVQIEHPVIRIAQYPKGDWNFQRIFQTNGPSTPRVPGRNFGDFVVLDSVSVHDAQFILTRPWEPDDSLRGAKRDSAIRVNLASTRREIRKAGNGYTHTYRWTGATAFLPRVRLADPDSDRFGKQFVIQSMQVEEQEPPFSFRSARGVVRKLGDSVMIDMKHFDLPASTGSATAKIWWGSNLPVRLDVRVKGDSVSLKDVAWVYPTLPTTGGGRTNLHIYNNRQNLRIFEYALSDMDVRSTKSRLTGAMTFVVGGPVLAVTDVDLQASPVNFDLLRTLSGAPFPVDWQGDLYGYAKGPGGPLTHFVVNESDVTWRDTHVPGAVSKFSGRGELDILRPAFTAFHGFDVAVSTLDLRSIEYLFPGFPRIHGTAAGTATLDSSWLDVRFSKANVTHTYGPGEPSRVTGSGRVTYGEKFLTYDVSVNAEPLSLTMLSRAYDLGLKGLLSGPIQAKGIVEDLQVTADLTGPAGRIQYSGKVDAYPLSVAARGNGRIDNLDPSQLVAEKQVPVGSLSGTYQVDVRGDTNDIGTLRGSASVALERSVYDGNRIFPSQAHVRFAEGKIFVDTLRIESVPATVVATGALGLTDRASDSLRYTISVDSLGGLRPYVTRFLSAWTQPAGDLGPPEDSLSGSAVLQGTARGSLAALDVTGQLTGSKIFVRREAGRDVTGTFTLTDALRSPSGSGSVKFTDLDIGGIKLDTLEASVRLDAQRRGAFSAGALARNGVTLSTHGDVSVADSGEGTSLRVRDFALVTDSSVWNLAGLASIETRGGSVAIDSFVIANRSGGRVSLTGNVPDSGKAKILFRADSVALHDVAQIAQLKTVLSGWAHVTAQGAGLSAAPVMNMQARFDDVRYGGIRAQRVNATAEYENKRAQVALDLASGGRTVLLARGSLPLELKYFAARLLEDSLRGTVRTDSASFDVIEALIPGLHDATGRLIANVDIAGTWKHPDVAGTFRVDNGEVTSDALGVRLRGVNVDIGLFGHRDSLAIRRLVAWSGTGPADSLSLRGHVAYKDLENPYLVLRLDARTFHALDKRSLGRMDVSTTAEGLNLRGSVRGATLTGGIVVDRGTLFLPDPEIARKQLADLSSLASDTTASVQQLLPAPPSRLLESLRIEGVRVTLGDEVWLRSRDGTNIKLGGSLAVQRSSRRVRGTILGVGTMTGNDSLALALDGLLLAERGTYILTLGEIVRREFQVEGGTITFYPNPELSPELNISALHTVRAASEGGLGADIRIRVRLTGPLYPNPIVTLESAESFTLSQSNLVSYLIFGQPDFELGDEKKGVVQLAAQTLLPSAQTLAASQLRDVLGPLADIVQLRPGSTDPTLLSGNRSKAFTEVFWTSRLGAEKQLSDNLFVSVGTGICQLNPSNQSSSGSTPLLDFYSGLSGKIEWRLSSDASVKVGKEPAAQVCGRQVTGRIIQTPTQWGLSLFKSWRF